MGRFCCRISVAVCFWGVLSASAIRAERPLVDPVRADQLTQEAAQLFEAKRLDEAIIKWQEALKLHEALGNTRAVVKDLMRIGDANAARDRQGKAADSYRIAAKILSGQVGSERPLTPVSPRAEAQPPPVKIPEPPLPAPPLPRPKLPVAVPKLPVTEAEPSVAIPKPSAGKPEVLVTEP